MTSGTGGAGSSRARAATRPVHLVGSIPLASTADVFRAVARTLGDAVRRIPDGEPGVRKQWILWQVERMAAAAGIVRAEVDRLTNGVPFPQFRLAPGAGADDVVFGSLGYADEARASYALFAQLKAAGVIRRETRFAVCLPTPLAVVFAFMVREEEHVRPVWPAYERAMLREIDALAAAIPHGELALQWDIAAEFTTILEKPAFASAYSLDEVVGAIARACNHVPEDIELGLHFCYGDANHRHLVEPPDTRRIVTVANRLRPLLERPIAWLHLPVPRERDDEAYLAPLRELSLAPAEIYLGLIHLTDGLAGAQRRLATAKRVVTDFGVATECGFGRRPPETIPALLELHRAVALLG